MTDQIPDITNQGTPRDAVDTNSKVNDGNIYPYNYHIPQYNKNGLLRNTLTDTDGDIPVM